MAPGISLTGIIWGKSAPLRIDKYDGVRGVYSQCGLVSHDAPIFVEYVPGCNCDPDHVRNLLRGLGYKRVELRELFVIDYQI